jgi:hypothetical protein
MNPILSGILAFLIVCVVWTWFTKPEGFTSGNTPKDTAAKLKDSNNELNDILNVSTYRTSYEDMILTFEQWADNSMLNILAQKKIGLVGADVSAESIRLFNDLATFKKNLNDLMGVLDKTE